MTKQEIEKELLPLLEQQSNYVATKTAIMSTLSGINAKLKYGDKHDKMRLLKERVQYCTMHNYIDAKLRNISSKIVTLTVTKNNMPVPEEKQKSLIGDIVEIRNYYQQFAADGTRVSSLREMATEFVIKLNPIIRRHVNE